MSYQGFDMVKDSVFEAFRRGYNYVTAIEIRRMKICNGWENTESNTRSTRIHHSE
jgi:hypothetical protein